MRERRLEARPDRTRLVICTAGPELNHESSHLVVPCYRDTHGAVLGRVA